MSQILSPQRFLVQPQYPAQIAKNPLTLGLVSLFTPASGNATPIGGITPIIGADGVGFRATSQAAYYRASSTRIISGSTQWTVVVGFSTTQGLNGSGASLYCERGPSGGNILKVEGLGNSIPYLQMTVRDDAFSLAQFQGSTTVTNDGKFHIAAGVQYATNDRRLFIDGRLEASNSGTVSAAYTEAGVESRIGSDANDGSSLFAGPIYFVALYSRALDPTEIAAIWERRWDAFFKAPARRIWVATSSDVTVSLSGQAVTGSQGSLGVDTSVALSGQQGSLSSGTLSTAGDAIVALSGQSLSSAQGLLLPEIDVSLTGQSLSSSQGGLGVSLDVGLSGQSLALSQGTIGTGGDVTVALAGIGMIASQGTLSPPQTQSEGGHFAGVQVVGRKRKKRDLVDRDREDIKRLIREQIEGVQQEIVQAEVPQEVKKQAKAAIQPYQSASAVDVQAMQEELSKVRQMLHMWERQVKQQRLQRQIEEDEELLMMFL